ncbi:MAG: hypothetical protein JSU85_05500 [Candidatus Zixiibacteriota bacterium]|nr:MAG: hypothetical protein JSU85_05500 [candidate division Zixibacteria bacterium]
METMVAKGITRSFGVMITIIILLITFVHQSAFGYMCWSCDSEAREEIQNLIRLTKVDPYNRITTYLQSKEQVELLLNALDNEKYYVKKAGIEILHDLLTQANISQQMTSDLVIPSINSFIQSRLEEDTLQHQNYLLLYLGRDALWCAEKYILSEEDKTAALLAAVESTDNRLRRVALEMLLNINGNYEGVIGNLLRIKEKRENKGLLEAASRIQYCVKKIEIRQSLLAMDNSQKNTYFDDLLDEYVHKKRGWGTNEFVLWLITQFKLIGDNSSILTLRHIWNNESYNFAYRSAAQEALIYLEVITSEERSIIVD